MRIRWGAAALAAAGIVIVISSPTQAALLSGDPNALPAWQGTQSFFNTDGFFTLDVTVDYAVYAPGQYGGTDPSGGTQFVYAYQVSNNANPVSVGVSQFSVGLIPGSGAANQGEDASVGAPGLPGGISPDAQSLGATGARWFFIADTVDFADHSTVLLFTSPNAPQLVSATVADGGLSDVSMMPSPGIEVPEPATLALLGLGGLAFAVRRNRRR